MPVPNNDTITTPSFFFVPAVGNPAAV